MSGALSSGCAIMRPDHAIRVATGSVSEQLCTAAFVSGLDPDRAYVEMLAPEPGMGLIAPTLAYDVDRETRAVRATVAGGFASRAVDRDLVGCVLVHASPPAALPAGFALADVPASLPPLAGPAPVAPESPALRAALDRAFAETEDAPHHWTKAVVVAHDGRIVAERFDERAPVAAWSDARDPGHAITIDELLRMTSAYATTPSLGEGYGAGVWLNQTDAEMPIWNLRWGLPHAPRDAFFARGYLGQYVVVVPSARLVVARFGISHGPGHDGALVGRLVADVIDALGGAGEG